MDAARAILGDWECQKRQAQLEIQRKEDAEAAERMEIQRKEAAEAAERMEQQRMEQQRMEAAECQATI